MTSPLDMDLVNAILEDPVITRPQQDQSSLSFLDDLLNPDTSSPSDEFDTFCRVLINTFHRHITPSLNSIVTNSTTPHNEALSLVWEQANITTQIWHLLSNVQRIKSLLPHQTPQPTITISTNDGGL